MIASMITHTNIITLRVPPELRTLLDKHKLATGSNSLNATINELLVSALDAANIAAAREQQANDAKDALAALLHADHT
jgi:hypothetical protein